jgi:hypothetical protein
LPERTLPLSRAQPPEGEAVPIVQQLFAFARPLAARIRSARRPFRPAPGRGPYRLPHDVADRLRESLAPFRNRDAAFALAVFLARFWSIPGRVAGAFPIDRRALADHAGLELTEARVRGAIRTLEAVGFLDRAISAPGSLYKPTPEGLHRKPILFVFGPDYAPAFIAANARAAAARGRRLGDRRPFHPKPCGGRLWSFLRLEGPVAKFVSELRNGRISVAFRLAFPRMAVVTCGPARPIPRLFSNFATGP